MKTGMEHWWDDTGREKLKYWEEDLPNATSNTTNPT
jgi:hypothetical protein